MASGTYTCKLRTTGTEVLQSISGIGTFRVFSTTSASMVDDRTGSASTSNRTRRRHCHTWHLILRRATLNRVVDTRSLAYVSGPQSPGRTILHGQYGTPIRLAAATASEFRRYSSVPAESNHQRSLQRRLQ
jgi:hypothetical protein